MDNNTLSDSKVLIVDDNIKNIQILGTILMEAGYQIAVANNGFEALDAIDNTIPEIILLDVVMPELDGFQTCERLKKNPETEDIPVIFLTAKANSEDIVKGFEQGAVDYVTKPFNKNELLARVRIHLTIKKLQKDLLEKNRDLEEALANIKTLSGLVPICANCKKIRNDKGYWSEVEVYVSAHSDVTFSHGICTECKNELYGDFIKKSD